VEAAKEHVIAIARIFEKRERYGFIISDGAATLRDKSQEFHDETAYLSIVAGLLVKVICLFA